MIVFVSASACLLMISNRLLTPVYMPTSSSAVLPLFCVKLFIPPLGTFPPTLSYVLMNVSISRVRVLIPVAKNSSFSRKDSSFIDFYSTLWFWMNFSAKLCKIVSLLPFFLCCLRKVSRRLKSLVILMSSSRLWMKTISSCGPEEPPSEMNLITSEERNTLEL